MQLPSSDPVLVTLDASPADRVLLDALTLEAVGADVVAYLLLPRTARVNARLRPFATGSGLAVADAAEAYLDRCVDDLHAWRIAAEPWSMPSTDALADIIHFARGHTVSAVMTCAGRRRRWRRPAPVVIADAVGVPVLVVPAAPTMASALPHVVIGAP